MYIDLGGLSRPEIYAAMTQTIIPRPVAWVLSDNGDESYNLAPFSYFNAVSSEPPLVMLSIGKKPDATEKDTRINIRQRTHFVIHIPHREMAGPVTDSSVVLPRGESELERLGLRLAEFEGSELPRLADCRIAMACERYQILDIGPLPQALILGEIKRIYVDDVVIDPDASAPGVAADRVDPIARLGGHDYVTFGETITIPRPK